MLTQISLWSPTYWAVSFGVDRWRAPKKRAIEMRFSLCNLSFISPTSIHIIFHPLISTKVLLCTIVLPVFFDFINAIFKTLVTVMISVINSSSSIDTTFFKAFVQSKTTKIKRPSFPLISKFCKVNWKMKLFENALFIVFCLRRYHRNWNQPLKTWNMHTIWGP